MPRARRVCSCRRCPAHEGYGCATITPSGQSRCTPCRQAGDRARGTARERYPRSHETRFRPGVLRRDPLCVCTDTTHGHGPQCLLPSKVADHHPLTRKELVARGMDPDDPTHGRGLCRDCHGKHTAHAQPGGWNARA